MFIDYVTLLLLNMTAGLLVLAAFIIHDVAGGRRKRWGPVLGMIGLVALVGGFHMIFTWPLPGSFNMAYGEMSILFGAIYAAGGLTLWGDRSLLPVSVYAVPAGAVAILLGVRIGVLEMTETPSLAMAGFVLSGGSAILLFPVVLLRSNRLLRAAMALTLLGAAGIWAFIGGVAYWDHMERFQSWQPETYQEMPSEQSLRPRNRGPSPRGGREHRQAHAPRRLAPVRGRGRISAGSRRSLLHPYAAPPGEGRAREMTGTAVVQPVPVPAAPIADHARRARDAGSALHASW